MTKARKPGTTEAWERGELGESADSAKVASAETTRAINDALGLQMISIRLPKSVIDNFKAIAKLEGIGYQPLMRTALVRFAECESKRLVRDFAAQRESAQRESEKQAALAGSTVSKPPRRKQASTEPSEKKAA